MTAAARRRRVAALLGLPLLVLVLAQSASPARSTFPGRSGQIAFVRASSPCVFPESGIRCLQAIWISNLDGSGAKRLTDAPAARAPEWSPDGRRIVYLHATGRRGLWEVWVMNADGTGKRKVPGAAELGAANSGVTPAWSPDGQGLLFAGKVGKPPNTWPAAWSIRTDGTRARVLFAQTKKLYLTFGPVKPSLTYPTWSPRGGRIAYLSERKVKVTEEDGETYTSAETWLFVARPDGSARRALAPAYGGGEARPFDWSPNGRRIVYLARPRPTAEEEVYVVDLGGAVRRLTDRGEGGRFTQGFHTPRWSPDGRTIIFKTLLVGTTKTDDRFVAIDPDGSDLRIVGPGSKGCRHVVPGPEGQKNTPCPAWDPSWRAR